MALTWHPSFKSFFRYTFFSSLPPYYYNHKFGYLTTFGLFLFYIRLVITYSFIGHLIIGANYFYVLEKKAIKIPWKQKFTIQTSKQ